MKQKIILMLLALLMCSIQLDAQNKNRVRKTTAQKAAARTTPKESREYQVGNDGFEWYKVSRTVNGQRKVGAEDRNGNMMIPVEYDDMAYSSDNNPLETGFWAEKGEFVAWYNKSGKCVIPYTRGYTVILKEDEDEFGTYYLFLKSDGGGICDRNGREVVSIMAEGISLIHIRSMTIKGKKQYYLEFQVNKNGKACYGIADANGKIIVPTEQHDYSTALDLAYRCLTTTNNPLAGNKHETLAEAEGRSSRETNSYSSSSASSSSSSSNSSNSSNSITTVVIEQHGPVQVWVPCGGCQLSPGRCSYCNGSGWGYNNRLCSRCNGTGKCTICNGTGGHNEVQYR